MQKEGSSYEPLSMVAGILKIFIVLLKTRLRWGPSVA